MKQIYLLVAMMCMIAFTASAQLKTLTINQFNLTETPVIDGEIDDIWYEIDPLVLTPGTPTNSFKSGQFRLAWNDTAFFYLLEIQHNPFNDEFVTGKEDWESDRAEVFFNVAGEPRVAAGADNGQAASGSWRNGKYQFVSPWYDGVADTIVRNMRQWPEERDIHYAYVLDRELGNYIVEMCIPFRSARPDTTATPFVGEDGKKIGFEVQITGTQASPDFVRVFNNWSAPSGIAGVGTETWNTFINCAEVTLSTNMITSISSVKKQSLSVYPNPAENFISLKLDRETTIDIYNVNGKVVKSFINSLGNELDINDLPKGVYIIKADSYVGKFVK